MLNLKLIRSILSLSFMGGINSMPFNTFNNFSIRLTLSQLVLHDEMKSLVKFGIVVHFFLAAQFVCLRNL